MSDLDKPVTGLVISYNYLWRHQHERGEESGRKARPVCVAVPVGKTNGEVMLFPITTQQPGKRIAIEIPETERRRLSLGGRVRCWIIVDEGNHDILPTSFHLEPVNLNPATYSYGTLSPAFLREFLRVLGVALRTESLRVVPRD